MDLVRLPRGIRQYATQNKQLFLFPYCSKVREKKCLILYIINDYNDKVRILEGF